MNETGTKLTCAECGGSLVITNAGKGQVQCHGPMAVTTGGGSRVTREVSVEEQHYDPFYD